MPLDWTQPLQTRHDKPRAAVLMDGLSPSGKRRVAIIGDRTLSVSGGKSAGMATGVYDGNWGKEGWPTIFLFDDAGRCNTGGADSPFDLVNVADTLAAAA
jgi:adenylylsulfate kinase-like enzyme